MSNLKQSASRFHSESNTQYQFAYNCIRSLLQTNGMSSNGSKQLGHYTMNILVRLADYKGDKIMSTNNKKKYILCFTLTECWSTFGKFI